MRQNSLKTSLLGIALLVACVLGCNLGKRDTAKNGPNGNSNTSPTPPSDIAGNYDVTGTNETGTPYKGTLSVIKHGEVYQFRWNAGKEYDGVGVPNGNIVAVAFTVGTNGKGCGVINYDLLSDGTLDGKWGYWGVNESGTETATRTEGSGLEGSYSVTGTNPNGHHYKAALSVKSTAGGYTFSWNNGSSGYGLKQGQNVSVGIGGARCAFMRYQVKPDGALDGVWAGFASEKTGTEHATRK